MAMMTQVTMMPLIDIQRDALPSLFARFLCSYFVLSATAKYAIIKNYERLKLQMIRYHFHSEISLEKCPKNRYSCKNVVDSPHRKKAVFPTNLTSFLISRYGKVCRYLARRNTCMAPFAHIVEKHVCLSKQKLIIVSFLPRPLADCKMWQ